MAQAVVDQFPEGTRVSTPAGGYVIWVEMPQMVDALALFRMALEAGISVVPGHLFEQLGFRYFGPIDGHNVDELVTALANVQKLDGVTLLHVMTEKGKGVPGSETAMVFEAANACNCSSVVQTR